MPPAWPWMYPMRDAPVNHVWKALTDEARMYSSPIDSVSLPLMVAVVIDVLPVTDKVPDSAAEDAVTEVVAATAFAIKVPAVESDPADSAPVIAALGALMPLSDTNEVASV